MPYRMISGRPLAQEVKRLLDQETLHATIGLTQSSRIDSARRLHDTRKHIKKARALLELARRPLGDRYGDAVDQLRIANRALGPLTDAHRVLETLAAARREATVQLPLTAFSQLRVLLEARARALEEAAIADDVRARTVRLIKSVALDFATTDLPKLDRGAIVDEICAAHASARAARRRAVQRPTSDAYHRWRRIVKREWHLFRLVTELTGDHLRDERHQLAALDACLGELHDVEVLTRAVAANSPLSRSEMARVLKALRTHAHDLRHLARRLSAVLDERPEPLARRLHLVWGSARRDAAVVRRWPHSA